MKAIIMAQGEGTRWHVYEELYKRRPDLPKLPLDKQLINMGKFGLPLISRTVLMLWHHGCKDICVISRNPFNLDGEEIGWTNTEPVGPLLHGILETVPKWDDRTLIILGDVAFSHAMIDAIISNPGLQVYGRVGANEFTGKEASELFAITFERDHQQEIIDHCHWMTKRGRPIRYPPKLWALYRLLAGFEHDDEGSFEEEILIQMGDYTDDIDSADGYIQWWNALNQQAALDDDGCSVCGWDT